MQEQMGKHQAHAVANKDIWQLQQDDDPKKEDI